MLKITNKKLILTLLYINPYSFCMKSNNEMAFSLNDLPNDLICAVAYLSDCISIAQLKRTCIRYNNLLNVYTFIEQSPYTLSTVMSNFNLGEKMLTHYACEKNNKFFQNL